jgi:electron transport complex protein RnfG
MRPTRTSPAGIVLIFSLIGLGLVTLIYDQNKYRIKDNEERATEAMIHSILPYDQYDNALFDEPLTVRGSVPIRYYLARLQGQPVAAIFMQVAPNGYNGNIHFVAAITPDGHISGIRVVSHHETPGLGDLIETSKSNWIEQFKGLSLNNPQENLWRVKRDGGQFDQFAGATITPRAMIESVKALLNLVKEHREEIFTLSKH